VEDPTLEQVDVPLKDLWTRGNSVLEQIPDGSCGPMEREDPMLEQVCWQDC